MMEFDDSLLDDPDALQRVDERLRVLAGEGARIRIEAQAADGVLAGLGMERPRAVIAVGAEARLIRAVLEPTCPVPFVAWPHENLPAWVGPLDVVIVLAGGHQTPGLAAVAGEAHRRGSRVLVAGPSDSAVVGAAAGRGTSTIPTTTGDPFAAAIAMLMAMQQLGLGPAVDAESVAAAVDAVAERSAPRHDLSSNPAKALAVALADQVPLVWGGTVLAARASRRVAEALRDASGSPALAGEPEHLVPIIEAAPARDPFADPDDIEPRPGLLILNDPNEDPGPARERQRLLAAAQFRDVRVTDIEADGGPVERYASLLAQGRWAAEYLRLGVGRL